MMNAQAQETLNFFKNDSLNKEIKILFNFLDTSSKTRQLSDSLVFIELIYIDRFDLSSNLDISFRTTLPTDCYKIKNNCITNKCVTKSFDYIVINNNRILLLWDAKTLINYDILKKNNNNPLSKILENEYFVDLEDDAPFISINNLFSYYIDEIGKLSLNYVRTYDTDTFFSLRDNVQIEKTNMK